MQLSTFSGCAQAKKRRVREAAREPELPMSREERAAEMARREVQREETKAIIRVLISAGMGALLLGILKL